MGKEQSADLKVGATINLGRYSQEPLSFPRYLCENTVDFRRTIPNVSFQDSSTRSSASRH